MDLFQDGDYVRLRSRVHGTYLHADENGRGVSLQDRRASMNAAWGVHLHGEGVNVQHFLLHSAAYGRYLAATVLPAPLGHSGHRVEQRNYDHQGDQAIRWVAVRTGFEDDIRLRNPLNGAFRCLRANGSFIRTGVSVDLDDFDNFSTKMHWVVEHIPDRLGMPPLPRPITLHLPGRLADLWPSRSRLIRYVRYTHNGAGVYYGMFEFKGRSVYQLRNKLACRLGSIMNVSNLAICATAGTFGRRTPLVVDLPRSRRDFHIVVIAAGTPDHAAVRYPDVDAP